MDILIYDCEIKRGIPPRGEDPLPGIEYCEGWGDHANMGVSVTGVYEYLSGAYRVFCDDNVDEMMERMASADLLVGFNSVGFDDKLLGATFEDFCDITTPRYDLLVEVWRAAGLKPKWGSPKTHGGFGLDAMCEANFGARKTGHGAMAPVEWQRGNIGSVIDYCLNDVRLTKMMFDRAMELHPLINPKGGKLLLRHPQDTLLVNVMREDYDDEPKGKAVDVDAHNRAEARKTIPPLNQPTNPHHWDNLVIEVEQLVAEDRVMVAVHDRLGLVVKRKLMLHEWSQPELNDAFNQKDGPAIVEYLREHETLYKNIGDDSGEA